MTKAERERRGCDTVRRCEQSGMTRKAFCEANSVALSTLNLWIRRASRSETPVSSAISFWVWPALRNTWIACRVSIGIILPLVALICNESVRVYLLVKPDRFSGNGAARISGTDSSTAAAIHRSVSTHQSGPPTILLCFPCPRLSVGRRHLRRWGSADAYVGPSEPDLTRSWLTPCSILRLRVYPMASTPLSIQIGGATTGGRDGSKLTRSMSKKRCTPENAACEGFFGRLKNEMYYSRNWSNVGIREFIDQVDRDIRWYNERRIKLSLGGLSPTEYRQILGSAA
jgi:transposase InsO family protein